MMLFLLFFLSFLLGFVTSVDANPFLQGGSAGEGGAFLSLSSGHFLQKIMAVQKAIHEAMSAQVEALKAGESLMPLWGLLGGSFLYGVFHVLAPGHGKIIIASYFLGQAARWREGIQAALIMSVGHTLTAIGIVFCLAILMGFSQFGTLVAAKYVELAGYGLIIIIGCWLFWQKLQGVQSCSHCGHAHGVEEQHGSVGKEGLSLFGATSLVPCTGSMIILLFTLAHQVLWAGILSVISIAIGMWMTMTAIGLGCIFLRLRMEKLESLFEAGWKIHLRRVLGLLASALIIIVGLLFFSSTLSALV